MNSSKKSSNGEPGGNCGISGRDSKPSGASSAIILAEAERDAQVIRGEGDNEAIKIYAEAFNKDKEFYGFIRSMEAYGNTLADPDTRLILSPDSDFFRYFDNRAGR